MSRTRLVRTAASALLVSAVSLVGAFPAGANTVGEEGCTPGYWKNHTDAWSDTGNDPAYSPSDTVGSVWVKVGARFPDLADDTLLEALAYRGGPGLEGMARNLLRHATAALLNVTVDGVDYPYILQGVINRTNNALKYGTRSEMEELKDRWAGGNELGCPL